MTADAPPPSRFWLNALFAAATLLGAWLLFQVQPLIAKRLLPWYGGGTAIWTTAMLFFQTALLGGYLYAHLAVGRLEPWRQVAVHAGLLTLAVALLVAVPMPPSDAWLPAGRGSPALGILVTLAACVGLPFVVLAATAPLVQAWFARANPGVSPYRLYALSNLGSLAALVSYPLVVEPNVGVVGQGWGWLALFALFAVACGASGWLSLRGNSAANAAGPPDAAELAAQADLPRRAGERFFWLALPACASAALLAITAHLCQDVASIPLLWIAPLVVYLITFILAFESDRWSNRWFWLPVLAVASFAAVATWHGSESISLAPPLAAHLALLLAIGMVCHGELARMRPPPARLTSFYLAIAAGGALGGLAVAVAAPLAFNDTYELPLAILAAWVLALATLVTDRTSRFYDGGAFAPLAGMVALLVALGIAMGAYEMKKRAHAVATARNFYGTLKVREIAGDQPQFAYYKLNNGSISHGAQYLEPRNRRVPTQYYHAGTGVGALLAAPHTASRRVGIVGLGVGTLAAYAEGGDSYRFYEINPQVIEFADKYFTFLADARERLAKVTVVPGDARLVLEREKTQRFDLLVVDAFTSDAIPAHLLTIEAFETYLRHLSEPDGVLAIHLSHRYLSLPLVVKAAADRLGLQGRLVDAAEDGTPAGLSSRWALVYRPGARLAGAQLGTPFDEILAGRTPVLWTDDYNNLLGILKREGD